MGVPGLYGWIKKRFPSAILPVPSDFSCDHLYFDLNGIIHPVCKDSFADLDNGAGVTNIIPEGHPLSGFKYSDEKSIIGKDDLLRCQLLAMKVVDLITLAKPQQSVFIAVDGVPPLSKVNQQRQRRYMDALDTKLKQKLGKELLQTYKDNGFYVRDEWVSVEKGANFDGNSISVGTEFMQTITEYLQEAIEFKLKQGNNEFGVDWANLEIIFTNYNVHGEGEHKILERIRSINQGNKKEFLTQGLTADHRHQKSHDRDVEKARCKHLVIADDGDLFYLGLTLREPNVYILRDENRRLTNVVQVLNRSALKMALTRLQKNRETQLQNQVTAAGYPMNFLAEDFEMLDLDRIKLFLQDYFDRFAGLPKDTSVNIQRFITDFVLLSCFFGNDFLPTLPFISISTNGIDYFIDKYVMLGGMNLAAIENNPDSKPQNDLKWLFSSEQHQFSKLKPAKTSFLSFCAQIKEQTQILSTKNPGPEAVKTVDKFNYLTDESGNINFRRLKLFLYMANESRDELQLYATYQKTYNNICQQFEKDQTCSRGAGCERRHGNVIPILVYNQNVRGIISSFLLGKYGNSPSAPKIIDITDLEYMPPSISFWFKGNELTIDGIPSKSDLSTTVIEYAIRNGIRFNIIDSTIASTDNNSKTISIVLFSGNRNRRENKEWMVEVAKREFESNLQRQFSEYHEPKKDEFGSLSFSNPKEMIDSYYKVNFEAKDPGTVASTYSIAHDYLESIQWVCHYYLNSETPNWNAAYGHHQAPFPQDLVDYLQEKGTEELKYHNFLSDLSRDDQFLHPCTQLMNILPPGSAELLPNVLRNYWLRAPMNASNIDSDLLKKVQNFQLLVPQNITEDMVQKLRGNVRWWHKLKVPTIDAEQVRAGNDIVKYCDDNGLFTRREMERFKIGKEQILSAGKTVEPARPFYIKRTHLVRSIRDMDPKKNWNSVNDSKNFGTKVGNRKISTCCNTILRFARYL